jgi:predicted DNA-binding antitoxin AbrB/MazE fold protein
MTIQAIYKNGVFTPLEAIQLPENSQVEISIKAADPAGGHPGLAPLLEIARKYPHDPRTPTDLAAQHDHYLYGTPKRP